MIGGEESGEENTDIEATPEEELGREKVSDPSEPTQGDNIRKREDRKKYTREVRKNDYCFFTCRHLILLN